MVYLIAERLYLATLFTKAVAKTKVFITTGYGDDLGPGLDGGMLVRGTISSDSTTCFTDGIDKNVISGNVGSWEKLATCNLVL